MSEHNVPRDPAISQTAVAWLECQNAGTDPYDWVEDQTLEWIRGGNSAAMRGFVLELCEAAHDRDTIEKIGVGPLYDMVTAWPDATLTWLEADAATQPVLLQALSIVITSNASVRKRIDMVLARPGH